MPVTKCIWDGENCLMETDGNGAVQTVYTYEPEQYGNLISSRVSGTTHYHHYDALGSTRQLSNAAGAVSDTWIYDAWGNVVARTGTTAIFLQWVGQVGYYYDPETGTFWVRDRPLEPANARWTTVDPMLFINGQNLFMYVFNRPQDESDPKGSQVVLSDHADDTHIKNAIGTNVGYCVPGEVNCLGFACGLIGKSLGPAEDASFSELMTALGFKCRKGVTAYDCEKHCGKCQTYIELYIYIRPGIRDEKRIKDAKEKIKDNLKKLKAKDTFTGKDIWWDDNYITLDYHALAGTGAGTYCYQEHKAPVGADDDTTRRPPSFIPTEKQKDFPFSQPGEVRIVEKYCCCKYK